MNSRGPPFGIALCGDGAPWSDRQFPLPDDSGGVTYRFVAEFVVLALDVQRSTRRYGIVRSGPVSEENVPVLSSDFHKWATEGMFQECLDYALGVPRNGSS